ncbi:MAG TPA: phage tail protein [Acidimicrobiales bacterium]|nr:phage tail protein [Acidimicrobiales bacterium]
MTDLAVRPAAPPTPFEGRGLVAGLGTPRPLGELLPALLQEDELCMRLMAAFDEVLAPAISVIDCFDSYLDPGVAPSDFVEWLAGWVGLDLDGTWPAEELRNLVGAAIRLYRDRGTPHGLADLVELYAGVRPTIEESGGCIWSSRPNTALPGSDQPCVAVLVPRGGPRQVNTRVLDRIVTTGKPAHLPHRVEMVLRGDDPTNAALPANG